ncbi:MAG: hypothetical protein SOZ24_03925 [Treponema sp.]|nr:hypothetical protein [Treponema sp.]
MKRNERRRIGGRGDRRSPEANEGGVERTGRIPVSGTQILFARKLLFFTLNHLKFIKKIQDLKRNERRRIGGRGDRRSLEANEGGVERTGRIPVSGTQILFARKILFC